MRLHEQIGLFEHCASENQEKQQIIFSLCTVHTPAFGERRKEESINRVLNSLSKILES